MVKQIVLGTLLLLVGVGLASGQSNQRLDELLAQAPARMDSAVYLLLAAGGLIPEDTELDAAFSVAVSKGYLGAGRRPDDKVSLEDLAFLVMKTQRIPGGLEWSLLPNPRAAYRELSFRRVINTSAGPGRSVAGDEVVRTLSDSLALKGVQP